MNNNNIFLSQQNIQTLWDVISDEKIFNFLTRENQKKIADLFSENITNFFEIEKKNNNNLIDLNKKYIILILNYIKKNYDFHINKIKIFDEQISCQNITAEQLQNEKKSQFEKDLHIIQKDFENSINIKVPPIPDFSEKYEDLPISEMDKKIKEITAKRNYDVEQINKNFSSVINQSNDWLKPQKTSLKNEKLIIEKNNDDFSPNNHNKNILSKKNVTWGLNKDIIDEEENDLFKKLKKIDNHDNLINNSNKNLKEIEIIYNDRITHLENQMIMINEKIDLLLISLNKN
jgi:hypothetical protein